MEMQTACDQLKVLTKPKNSTNITNQFMFFETKNLIHFFTHKLSSLL